MNKNSKSTFKKIKKYVCISLIFAIFSAASIILYSNSLTRNAKEYIAYKYGVTQSEITEVEEYKAHIETEFVLLEKFNIWVVPAKWVFNVDGKNFNVEYFQKHYVDDFQLEDLEIWCTEYLQDNVDSNISGIELYSDMIFKITLMICFLNAQDIILFAHQNHYHIRIINCGSKKILVSF